MAGRFRRFVFRLVSPGLLLGQHSSTGGISESASADAHVGRPQSANAHALQKGELPFAAEKPRAPKGRKLTGKGFRFLL
jgi:hypothetical protein